MWIGWEKTVVWGTRTKCNPTEITMVVLESRTLSFHFLLFFSLLVFEI